MQVGDGRGEALHRDPVVLSDVVRGELEREPWQYQPYKAGDATWLHAAQRRHAHRRRPNVTIGVASVDLSGPHVATPMPGMRVGSNGARYFVVMVVRPDLSQGRRDQACQADEAGDAHVGHAVDGDVAVDAEVPEPAPADEVRTYNPQTPLVYVEILEFKHQAAEAIMKMVALMREELGNFPTSLPESWTVHRLHSDKGSELLPKALDTYCLDKGIRRTTTQGYDPSANGAAEQAVGFIKRKSRFLLAGARLSSTWWGVAAKTAATYARCDVGLLSWPRIPFGTRVMAVRDPAYRDAFAARAHPAVVFGPSESVPGGYITYADGRLKDLTNVAVTSLEAHDMAWVKGNLDLWEEPVGVQRPLRPEAWDPAHAADPSVRLPRVRRQPPAEAPAPEEENPDEQQPIDRPGDQPGDYWLEPFDVQEEERTDVARREEEHNFGIILLDRFLGDLSPCNLRYANLRGAAGESETKNLLHLLHVRTVSKNHPHITCGALMLSFLLLPVNRFRAWRRRRRLPRREMRTRYQPRRQQIPQARTRHLRCPRTATTLCLSATSKTNSLLARMRVRGSTSTYTTRVRSLGRKLRLRICHRSRRARRFLPSRLILTMILETLRWMRAPVRREELPSDNAAASHREKRQFATDPGRDMFEARAAEGRDRPDREQTLSRDHGYA